MIINQNNDQALNFKTLKWFQLAGFEEYIYHENLQTFNQG